MEEKFKFINHQKFDDPYVLEMVYLEIDGKYRVLYVRKKSKNGVLFWTVPSIGILVQGEKQYFPTFMCDSQFLSSDIRTFLDSRSWEKATQPEPKKQEDDLTPSSNLFPF